MNAKELFDELVDHNIIQPGDIAAAEHPNYNVEVILNPGEGPDEQALDIANVSWDHEKGVCRLEVA